MAINRGKKSLTLDLKSERGKSIFLELVKSADVMVENFVPGTMNDLGLGHEMLSALNPRLIICATSGASGDRGLQPSRCAGSHCPGHERSDGHHRRPDRPPVKVGVPVTDLTAALFGATPC